MKPEPFTQCYWCGKILKGYSGHGIPYCPGCARDEAEALKKIRAAADKNPGMNAMQLSAATGLYVSKIKHFIDDGRVYLRH